MDLSYRYWEWRFFKPVDFLVADEKGEGFRPGQAEDVTFVVLKQPSSLLSCLQFAARSKPRRAA
jgi:hypothetical protein